MTYIKRPCKCPVCGKPEAVRAAEIWEAGRELRAEQARAYAQERARSVIRKTVGGFSVELDDEVWLFATFDETSDARDYFLDTGYLPVTEDGLIMLLSDPPEHLAMP